MFETGMSALVLKICSEYAKALGLNFPPCVQQEINAIAQYVDLHTVKDLKVEQNGSVVTITCFTEGEQEKVFTVTLPEVNVDTLSALLKGSSSVVVDKSEDGRTLVVRLDQSVIRQINGKLDKPTTPTAKSAVVIGTDGTTSTKPLSEIGGGGGHLYQHDITFAYHEGQSDYAYLFITFFAADKKRKMETVSELYTGIPYGLVRMSYYNALLSTNNLTERGLPAFIRSYGSPSDVKLSYYDLTGAVQEINISSSPSWELKNYSIIDIESRE